MWNPGSSTLAWLQLLPISPRAVGLAAGAYTAKQRAAMLEAARHRLTAALLEASQVTKRFGATLALDANGVGTNVIQLVIMFAVGFAVADIVGRCKLIDSVFLILETGIAKSSRIVLLTGRTVYNILTPHWGTRVSSKLKRLTAAGGENVRFWGLMTSKSLCPSVSPHEMNCRPTLRCNPSVGRMSATASHGTPLYSE